MSLLKIANPIFKDKLYRNDDNYREIANISSDDIIHGLDHYYNREEYVKWKELRVGTGHFKESLQRIDYFAMSLFPSHHWQRVAIEIKVSIYDFKNEIKNPSKRKIALLYSNLFYFAVPKGLIKIDDLPPECGLMEYDKINGITIKHNAPFRDSMPPTWNFTASLVRRRQINI